MWGYYGVDKESAPSTADKGQNLPFPFSPVYILKLHSAHNHLRRDDCGNFTSINQIHLLDNSAQLIWHLQGHPEASVSTIVTKNFVTIAMFTAFESHPDDWIMITMIINMVIKGDIKITIMITIIVGTIEMPPRSPNPAYLAPIQAWVGGRGR